MEFQGYRLVNRHYELISPTAKGHLWSESLQLYLGLHQAKLRYFGASGELIPTPEEAAKQAQTQAQEAEARATRLAEQLQALGIEPTN